MNLDASWCARLTNPTGLVDGPRLDTHLAAKGVDDTRAVGSNETRLRLTHQSMVDLKKGERDFHEDINIAAVTYLDLILLRNTLSNANNQANLVLNGLNDSVGGVGGRNVEHGCVGLGLLDGLSNPIQTK